uniref:Peptidase M15C domain-containing protein n=1 Tax=uncultured bacterium contig00094 TaxID=1181565 RepID=A0A806KKK5_9BACT|nr:hypothetical protein [uncultured bacterium contig00094]
MRIFKIICGVFYICLLFSCHGAAKVILPPAPSTLAIINDPQAQQKLLLTFAEAYPGKISAVEFVDNDWTMVVNGTRFYFANGRFLPERLHEQWENYLPYDFYKYPWTGTDKERQVVFNNPVYSTGSSFLFDALYSSPTEAASWRWQEKYSFLGVKMLVHSHISPLLDSVSDKILIAAGTDPSINEWIAELQTDSPSFGWNWRSIADTNRRSNHSYGIAIDLLPKDLKGRLTYWQWNKGIKKNKKAEYYLPPETVVRIFEEHGFIWGGKWDLIDTMHFEYRPEILLLNGFSVIR